MKINILVTGGVGFIGTKILRALAAMSEIKVAGEIREIGNIHVFDITAPEIAIEKVSYHCGSLNDEVTLEGLIADINPGVVYHLAAVVSSAAEQNFDLGMQVNFDGTRALLEACRALAQPPRFIFASSVAVFGTVLGDVEDSTPTSPLSSYGATKVLGEVLVNEYSRRNFIDAIVLRLPTITVRPGIPNLAASSFVSGIIREPLAGKRSICPVDPSLQLWVMSPRLIVENMLRALAIPRSELGESCVMNLPGITVSVQQMVDALQEAGGDSRLIDWQRDEKIESIVSRWPGHMNTQKSSGLGFCSDTDIHAIINAFIEDERS